MLPVGFKSETSSVTFVDTIQLFRFQMTLYISGMGNKKGESLCHEYIEVTQLPSSRIHLS